MTDQAAPQEATEGEEAFAAGFDSAPAQAAPETAPEASATEGQDAQDVAQQEGQAAETPAPKPVVFASEEEFNAAVTKAATPLVAQAQAEIRKNFGQIGEVNRALKDIRERLAASETSRKKLTAEVFKRTNEELPGIGESLAADLSEYLGSPAVAAEAAQAQAAAEAQGQTFDADAFFQTKIGPALQELEARAAERAELRIVKSIHRDFDKVVASNDFKAWLGSLPPERAKEIRESEDGLVAADAVTEFKAALAKRTQEKNRNQNRLEGALTPQGDGQPASHLPNDEEALFARGFANAH